MVITWYSCVALSTLYHGDCLSSIWGTFQGFAHVWNFDAKGRFQYDIYMNNDNFSRIAQQFDLVLIVQFGSTVKGSAGPMSDMDVLVHGTRALDLSEEAALRATLAEALGAQEDKTDLVFLYRASPLLASEALWQGRLIYGDTVTLRTHQVRAWKRLQEDKKFARWRRAYIQTTANTPAPAV